MPQALPSVAPLCCPSGGARDLLPWLLAIAALLAGRIVFQTFKQRKGKPNVKNVRKLALVATVVVAAGIVFALKPHAPTPTEAAPATAPRPIALPRLLELGADKCIPCRQMAPILAELRTAYAGQLQVDFIDVWKNAAAAEDFGVRVIPLQIFFAADGRELFRHEGFFAKEDILAKWRELGFEFR